MNRNILHDIVIWSSYPSQILWDSGNKTNNHIFKDLISFNNKFLGGYY